MRISPLLALVALTACFVSEAVAQTCEPSAQRNASEIHGEISGKNTFSARVDDTWSFRLEPALHGWDIRVRDVRDMDLTQVTPPFHSVPNPREIYGWHFRNAANKEKNTGDINAPQHLRLFEFSPSLTGTGGFRPPQNEFSAEQPSPDQGRGMLRILDMGLADLEPGQKARMNYLKFNVCLTWPKTKEELNAQSPNFLDEERESMYGCGLDPNVYELSAWMLPRWLGGDMDGDDAIDEIAPIIRKSDGVKGIAICRASTWISILGYSAQAQAPLKTLEGEPRTETYFSLAQYLNSSEYWKLVKGDNGNDRLILGRSEKAEVAISWTGRKFTHQLLWVFVEP